MIFYIAHIALRPLLLYKATRNLPRVTTQRCHHWQREMAIANANANAAMRCTKVPALFCTLSSPLLGNFSIFGGPFSQDLWLATPIFSDSSLLLRPQAKAESQSQKEPCTSARLTVTHYRYLFLKAYHFLGRPSLNGALC